MERIDIKYFISEYHKEGITSYKKGLLIEKATAKLGNKRFFADSVAVADLYKSAHGGYMLIIDMPKSAVCVNSDVICKFDEEPEEFILNVNRGDLVNIAGDFGGIELGLVVLNNCEVELVTENE